MNIAVGSVGQKCSRQLRHWGLHMKTDDSGSDFEVRMQPYPQYLKYQQYLPLPLFLRGVVADGSCSACWAGLFATFAAVAMVAGCCKHY